MEFKAEIVKTSQRKLVSNDNQYEIVLRTNNPQILDLGKLNGDTMIHVQISLDNNKTEDLMAPDVIWDESIK